MKKYTAAILGCGGRGHCYGHGLSNRPEEFEITTLCDVNPAQLQKMHALLGLEGVQEFTDPALFLEEKRADLLVIATPDRDHVPQAVRALELGYDILLEKPITDDRDELKQLVDAQHKFGGQVMICHELRFGAGFRKLHELVNSGVIGKLIAIDASERPYYWHWAQAYVRGIGATLEFSHPAILAKCSHDLDLVQWYAGSKCDTVSSLGDTRFFTPENAPVGATDRCPECPHVDTCPYSAKRIYVDMWHENGEPAFDWPFSRISIDVPLTEEKLLEGLKTSPFARCAFKCNTEQPDHQVVQMYFENGVKASLTMAFSADGGRRIALYGSLGEIIMDERTDDIVVMPYGGSREVIPLSTIIEGGHGHGGGDDKMMNALYGMLAGTAESTTSLAHSLEAHYIGISAEESRKNGGILVKVHD